MPFIEPIGNSREDFFEAKLVLGHPWYFPTLPEVVHREDGSSVLNTPSDVTPRSNWGGNNWTLLFLSSGTNTCATRCYANDWKDVFAMPSSGSFVLAVPRR